MNLLHHAGTRRQSERQTHRPRRLRRRLVVATLAAVVVGLSAGVVTGGASLAHATVAKGISSPQLESEPAESTARAGMVREIRRGLGAQWLRLGVSWAALQPTRGEHSPTELARLDALVGDLHAAGVRVILTMHSMPSWATDPYWWSHPPFDYPEGPQAFYPISGSCLKDYGALSEFLARRYKGRVHAMECWNEPNVWFFLYPQRTADDPYYAARTYFRMLKSFRAGVKRAGTGVRVVAGATAPVGLNDRYRTSPQRFARFLRRAGASRHFDVYSHHPYTPGGSVYKAPDRPPNDPTRTVTLSNLRALLRLFPKKPFYLTEYGYNTRPNLMFGLKVNERTQARYLKAAFAQASRYRQVRLLVWYLLRDWRPETGPANGGVYTGLRRLDGTRKPAWHAFRRL